jgi:hypothetical protein
MAVNNKIFLMGVYMKTGQKYRFFIAFVIIAGAAFSSNCFTDVNKNKNLLELAISQGGLTSAAQSNYPGAAGTLRFIHYTNDLEYGADKTLNVKVDKQGNMSIDSGSLEYTLEYEFTGGQARMVEHFNLNFAPYGQYNMTYSSYDVIENTTVEHRAEYYVKNEHGQWVKYWENTENTVWDGGLHFNSDNMEGIEDYRIVVTSPYYTIEWHLFILIAIP